MQCKQEWTACQGRQYGYICIAGAEPSGCVSVCVQVFFKMDKSGDGEEVELRNLVHARELSFLGFTHDMFQEVHPPIV